jgi:hypothetical protein
LSASRSGGREMPEAMPIWALGRQMIAGLEIADLIITVMRLATCSEIERRSSGCRRTRTIGPVCGQR